MKKILIIEDDVLMRQELKSFLEKYNYNVTTLSNFDGIVNVILSKNVDLILLDINLPVYDGYYICREIRKKSEVPIIIVTSRDSDMDELMSMNLGADDFITKPYNTQILLARIVALLKRTDGANYNSRVITYNGMELNLSNATFNYNGKELELTKNEMKILSCLMENKESIVSREVLMEYLWKSDYFVDDSTLSVNIARLRKKLESIGIENAIETRRGLGYIIS